MNKRVASIFAFLVLWAGTTSAADFPATAEFRKALTGPGYVLVVNTTIKEDFPAILTVRNETLGTERRYEIFLTWRHKNQFGPLEGITLYAGDAITIGNNNYSSLYTYVTK